MKGILLNKKMKRTAIAVILASCLVLSGCAKEKSRTEDVPVLLSAISVDFADVIGPMKPLNGINNGPKAHAAFSEDGLEWELDATELYQQCRIPFVRTHDMEYPDGSDRFIDVHCIFPDMSRDPEDPDAYHFAETDEYIQNILASGAKVYYRLGESIAISEKDAKYQHKPESFETWAEICAHIIAHYNSGWNNGYEYNIQYWQIWNEPDQKRQWNGTAEDYYALYKITARRIKEQFPDVLVGASAEASVTAESLQTFLDWIRLDGEETPLDFLGWHIYTNDPSKIVYRANMVRNVLDQNDFDGTQAFLDEWNYVDDWDHIETTWEAIRSPSIAAFYGACMTVMQNEPVDGAMYYDGSLTGDYAFWCGLYDEKGNTLPGYYGFYAFSKLAELGNQVRVTSQYDPSEQGVYICAAAGETEQGILITNTGPETVRFQMKLRSSFEQKSLIRADRDNPKEIVRESIDPGEKVILELTSGEWIYIQSINDMPVTQN